jgi:undecaprenyl-diphosphatase
MSILNVIILAIVQGLAELLPVSSSAHVVVAEKLMGYDPSSPEMTLLLVMFHTGSMFAVIAFFWSTWRSVYFSSKQAFQRFAVIVLWATLLTGIVAEGIKKIIERALFRRSSNTDIEQLFSHLELVAPALAVAGLLILTAGLLERREIDRTSQEQEGSERAGEEHGMLSAKQAGWMGVVQGLALPFRGLSRSGSTISTAMLLGVAKERAERFSFALAVVLTPAVVGVEALRLRKASLLAASTGAPLDLKGSLLLSLLGMVFSFLAGLVALRWLSSWLESGRWYLFGIYCIIASVFVYYLHTRGF